MRSALHACAGVLAAVAYLIVVGIIEVQQRAALNGVVVSWGNRPLAVESPHVPVLQFVTVAVLTGALVLAVAPPRKDVVRPRVAADAMAVALVVSVGIGLFAGVSNEYPAVDPDIADTLRLWWVRGSGSAAPHVAAVLLCVAAARR